MLTLTSSVSSIKEGSSTRVAYTITRTGDCSQALVVTLSSELAARLGLPETVTIAAGQSSARVQARVVNDSVYTGDATASITATAAGYTSSTTEITIVEDEKPTISVTLVPSAVTEGTDIVLQGTVSIDAVFATDTVVKLGSNYSGQIKAPSSVIIKAGETSATFEATVVNDNTAEIDKDVKITGAATGFNSGSATVLVQDDDLPQVELVLSKEIVSESDGYYALTATLVRRGGSNEAITVKLQDVDGIGLILPASIPMGAGVQNVKFTIGVVDDSLVNGERTGTIRGSIIIDDCGCDASSSSNGGMFETTVTVQDNDSPALSLSLSKTVLREGGEEIAILTVKSNFVSETDVIVTLGDGGLLNLPSVITIPAGQTSVTCEISAKSDGVTDGTQYTTITASADGYITGRGYMQVTDMDVPDLVVDSITLDGAAIAGQKVTVSIVLRNQGYAATDKAAPVEIRLSDGTVLGSVSAASGLEAGASTTLTAEVTLPLVSGQYRVTAEVDKNNVISELENDNNVAAGELIVIDSGYAVTANIQREVMYSAGNVTVTGALSTELAGVPVEGQTVNIYLYRNGKLMQTQTAQTDSSGAYQADFVVAPGVVGDFEVRAGVFSEVSETLDSFSVAGLSITNAAKELQWLIELGNSKTGIITVKNTGSVDLHNVELFADVLPDNIAFTVLSPAQDIAAGQTAIFQYEISGTALNVGDWYSDLHLSVRSEEGAASQASGYSYITSASGELVVSTNSFKVTASNETVSYVELQLSNIGGADTGKVSIQLPSVEWMSLYSGSDIDNIAPGETVTVVIKLDAAGQDILLNAPYAGNLAINSENGGSKRVSYGVTFRDSDKCSLEVN
ncbi:MAG: hypothetical protein IIV41_09325, partial [Akkermansia sp.]|nr:hypothetical protein [Akkermansia sp.]